MKLKYDNWKKITVEVYDKLKDLKTDINTEEEIIDVNVKVLSILCDCDENDILNLPLDKFKELIYKSEFLKNVPKVNLNDEYNINGVVYVVHRNLRTLTTAQYIDFQTLYKDKEVKLKNLLACFLIPKGKKYGEDYDVLEVADEIYKYMSIVDANSVMFFFYTAISSINKSYANLFNQGDEEDDEEGEERNEETVNRKEYSTFDSSEEFAKQWNWFYLIDQVSDLTKETWDNVLKKNIYEFLNLVCYIKSKRAMEKNEIEKFKNK